jgi:DNA-binding MarR family transcriptional regulator
VARTDDLHALDVALTRIGRVANSRKARELRAARSGVDLPPTALATLAAVYRHGPARLGTIADHVDLEPSRVSREVARLVADGFVEQRPDPHDRRAVSLRTTRRGRATFERYRAAADAVLAEAMADWSDADLHRLTRLVTRLATGLGATVP